MTTKLLSILQDNEKAYDMFKNDDINDTQIYQDMLAKVIDPYDILDINEAYFRYIDWLKLNKSEEVELIRLIFKLSINTFPYRDVSTGLVLPLFEIMYMLAIGYTIDTIVKTIATFPDSVEPVISPNRCVAICLSMIYPNRGNNIDLNSMHVEKETLDMTGPPSETETFIVEGQTIIELEQREENITRTVYTEFYDESSEEYDFFAGDIELEAED